MRPDAEFRHDVGRRLVDSGLRSRGDDSVGAFAGQTPRHGKPDPVAGPDDDCAFSCPLRTNQLIHCPPSTLKHCETM